MKLLIMSLLIFSNYELSYSEQLPSDFKKCSSKDTGCLKAAIQDALPKLANGIKDLDVPPLDPFKVSSFTSLASKSAHLVENYTKIEFSGLSKSEVKDISIFDVDKGKIVISFHVPEAVFSGVYDIKGKILILDVYGQGPFSIKFMKIKATMDMELEKYKKNGETFLKVKKSTLKADPESVHFQFDNLFDGNKLLGDNINKVLNDNWNSILYN